MAHCPSPKVCRRQSTPQWSRRLEGSSRTGIDVDSALEQAACLDIPQDEVVGFEVVRGYVGLGESYLLSVLRGWTDQPVETLKTAENLATTAIGVDGASAGAHALLGSVHLQFGQYDQAIDELNLAIDLNPSDAETYGGLCNALLFTGALQRAIDAGETALHFDPTLDVHHLWYLGTAYFLVGRMADATRVMEQTVARDPEYVFGHVILAAAYSESGRPEDTARAVAAVHKLDPFFDPSSFGSLFRNPTIGPS